MFPPIERTQTLKRRAKLRLISSCIATTYWHLSLGLVIDLVDRSYWVLTTAPDLAYETGTTLARADSSLVGILHNSCGWQFSTIHRTIFFAWFQINVAHEDTRTRGIGVGWLYTRGDCSTLLNINREGRDNSG